jgi:hypothetical protein
VAATNSRRVNDDGSVEADPWWREEVYVSSIKLASDHPKKVFSDVPMPVGVQIYILEGGKIVAGDYIPVPDDPTPPKERGLFRGRYRPEE